MVTGRTPYQGSPSELMYQHQRRTLPLELLEGVPQPIIILLEALLEKDPAQRFQSPAGLLKVMPAITAAVVAKREINRQILAAQAATFEFENVERENAERRTRNEASHKLTRSNRTRPRPDKISIARLPVTGPDIFGREEDIALLDKAWISRNTNIVSIVAWAGVGKSTLVNHWLRKMAARRYRSAEFVFGWSFYTQGTTGGASSADEFISTALSWFGDEDPQVGTEWEKGERLAKFVANRRTLLVLDGLEPLQNPPGSQEGRLRDPSLQALLRELAAFNQGLCVVTTRMPVGDIAEYEVSSAPRHELDQLSSAAGARLLQALGVRGAEEELRDASTEYHGHCLALTLLGSYLTDAYSGDVRCREEVSARLIDDSRQGAHARKVLHSYQTWFGEGPELSVLRMLGLFDRPVDEEVLGVLLKPPVVPGLTESLINLSPSEWRKILAKLRRARLLAGEDPHRLRLIDTHPLVREYFGEQLRNERSEAWKDCNKRLYYYFRALPPQLPDSFGNMEPLFLAAICACNAGLYRDDLQGKQRRASTKQTDRKKAMKIAEQYEQISQRKLPVHTVRQTLTALAREAYGETFPSATVHQFIEAWLKSKTPPVVAQSTHDFYRKSTKKFLEFLGTAAELDLSAVTRKMITEFRNQVAQKASATTTNHDLKAIKLIFRSAKRDGYIIEDPSEFVESVRRKSSDDARRPFTVPEIRKVIEVTDKEWKSLVLFGLYTGQRLADLATLHWDNIDLARNEIRIKTRKTGKRLAIPIAPPLKTHIESLPAAREGYLHPKAAATVTSQKRSGTLSNQFADLLAQAGLRDKAPHRSKGKGRDAKRSSNGLSFHALRHTAVSLLKDAGIPEAVVMELVGHDSEAMSAHYTHVGTEALAKAVAALPEI